MPSRFCVVRNETIHTGAEASCVSKSPQAFLVLAAAVITRVPKRLNASFPTFQQKAEEW